MSNRVVLVMAKKLNLLSRNERELWLPALIPGNVTVIPEDPGDLSTAFSHHALWNNGIKCFDKRSLIAAFAIFYHSHSSDSWQFLVMTTITSTVLILALHLYNIPGYLHVLIDIFSIRHFQDIDCCDASEWHSSVFLSPLIHLFIYSPCVFHHCSHFYAFFSNNVYDKFSFHSSA